MPLLRRKDYVALLIGDVAVFAVSLWLTLWLRNLSPPSWREFEILLTPFLALFAIWLTTFFIAGLYNRHTSLLRTNLSERIFYTQGVNTVIAALFFFFLPEFGVAPKTILFIYLFISSALIFVWRVQVFPRAVRRKRGRAVLIGSGPDLAELREEIGPDAWYPLEFRSVIETAGRKPSEVLTTLRAAVDGDKGARILVVDTSDRVVEPILPDLYDLVLTQRGFVFVDAYELYESVFERTPLGMIRLPPILSRLERTAFYDVIKRGIDILAGLALGLVLVLVTPFVAAAIKLEDGGRVFVTQKRVGRYQRPVRILKFRSMSGIDQGDEALQTKLVVTRVGKVIRRLHLDELPQAVNLLHGHLALVGPRPEISALADHYAMEIPHYHVRHLIKPGLTGWARIRHKRDPHHGTDVTETRRKLAYDLYYLAHRSVMFDIYVLLQTVRFVLTARGT